MNVKKIKTHSVKSARRLPYHGEHDTPGPSQSSTVKSEGVFNDTPPTKYRRPKTVKLESVPNDPKEGPKQYRRLKTVKMESVPNDPNSTEGPKQ